MSFTKAQLVSEIANDPAGLGYAGKTDAQIFALITAPTFTRQGPIPIGAVLGWIASNNLLTTLQTTAAAPGASQNNAGIFLLASNGNVPVLDPTIAGVDTLVTALVTAGIFSAAQKTAFYTLGSVPASRLEILFGTGTSIDPVTLSAFFNRRP